MSTIVDIFAREILDGRGNPTVEDVILKDGTLGRAARARQRKPTGGGKTGR